MQFGLSTVAIAAVAFAAAVGGQTPKTKTTALPALPDARGLGGAFAGIDRGHLLVGGGANFPDGIMPWNGGTKMWHDRVFALDLDAPRSAWREVGRLPLANAYGVSLTVPEGVLIVGGSNATRHFSDVWLMALTDNVLRFRPLPALPLPLAHMAGAVVGRRVHIAGGIDTPDATTARSDHWTIDLDDIEKGWRAAPSLPAQGRILATASALGNAFYVLGGCALAPDRMGKPERTYLRDVWRFSNGMWTRRADLPRASAAAGSPAPADNKNLFVVSGDDGTQVRLPLPEDHKGFSPSILRYDSARNTWHDAGRLDVPAPVTLPTAPWRDGFIFVSGEVKPGVRTAQVFFLQVH